MAYRIRLLTGEHYAVIADTVTQLERASFYWGPLTVKEAHDMLRDAPVGRFLIRDSQQNNYLFTLSYRAEAEPLSVRIKYKDSKWFLTGSRRLFDSLFALLDHYASPNGILTAPYRHRAPMLQEVCRARVLELVDKELVPRLPITSAANALLMDFPHGCHIFY